MSFFLLIYQESDCESVVWCTRAVFLTGPGKRSLPREIVSFKCRDFPVITGISRGLPILQFTATKFFRFSNEK